MTDYLEHYPRVRSKQIARERMTGKAEEILKNGGFDTHRGCEQCGGPVTENTNFCLKCQCGLETTFARSDFEGLFIDFLNMLSAAGRKF
jgi:hypothetical protein